MNKEMMYVGKKVEYNIETGGNIVYKYDGITSEAYEKLAPSKHKVIIDLITKKNEEYKVQQEQDRVIRMKIELEEMKVEIKEENDKRKVFERELLKVDAIKAAIKNGYILKMKMHTSETISNYQKNNIVFSLTLSGMKCSSGEIHKDDTVYSDWGHHKTNKQWVLEYDFKNTRYSKLENAINKYVEKIEQKLVDNKIEEEAEERKNREISKMEKWCEANNLEFEEEWRQGNYNVFYGRDKNRKRKFKIIYNNDKKEVVVLSITLINPTTKMVEKMLEVE